MSGTNGPLDTTGTGVNVGSLSAMCFSGFQVCTGNLAPGVLITVPFTLGEKFAFSEELHFDAESFSDGITPPTIANGTGSLDFSFILLEADRKTPVQVYALPEPSTLPLLFLGGLGLFLGRRYAVSARRRRR